MKNLWKMNYRLSTKVNHYSVMAVFRLNAYDFNYFQNNEGFYVINKPGTAQIGAISKAQK